MSTAPLRVGYRTCRGLASGSGAPGAEGARDTRGRGSGGFGGRAGCWPLSLALERCHEGALPTARLSDSDSWRTWPSLPPCSAPQGPPELNPRGTPLLSPAGTGPRQPRDAAHLHGLRRSLRRCSPACQHLLKASTAWSVRKQIWGGGGHWGCVVLPQLVRQGHYGLVSPLVQPGHPWRAVSEASGHHGASWKCQGVRASQSVSGAAEPQNGPIPGIPGELQQGGQ